MPRKGFSRFDYDDGYDNDGGNIYDYADDYDYEVEENGTEPQTIIKQEAAKTGIWRCPICTYDNEDSMSACDICGVLRNPLVKFNSQGNTAVDSTCKDSGVSLMAKSLFASLPQHVTKKCVLFESQNNASSKDDHVNCQKRGNIRGTFQEFNSAFSSQINHRINIAPFKFDSLSPDDLVSTGLQSVKLKTKSSVSSAKDINIHVQSARAGKSPEISSVSVTKEKHNRADDSSSASASGNKGVFHRSMSTDSISSKPKQAEIITNVSSIPEYTPEAWMIPSETDDKLSQLNLAIVGHVDSGKSTLSGRLLHLLGQISQKEMHKYEKEAKEQGKGSFAYAWALDESSEERERGITMTVGVAFFTSRKYHIVLLDSPGHRDFVPNMISGATQADVAILVVDASMGSFEAGIDSSGGQTREHAQLIRSFGVDQIIAVVNKMDMVEYSQERFESVKQKLGKILRSCGFKDSSISWIPASAMENQNLVAKPSEARLSWFKGPNLLDTIDSLKLPTRDYSMPLLLPICDFVKSQSQGQVSVCGKMESGAIRSGFKVLVMPSRVMATVRSLERDSRPCNIARAGDNVTVSLQGIESNQVMAGGVLCHPDFPVKVANHLELKILVLDVPTPILIGAQLEFHIHHAKEAAKVVKISALLDPKTGQTAKKSPRILLAKQNAIIEVVLQGAVCVGEYINCRALGRVFLRSSGKTVALGIVTQIIKGD